MKLTTELSLKQSLTMTNDMRLAIDMLAMTTLEVDQLIDEELEKNPYLEEGEHYVHSRDVVSHSHTDGVTAFDIALKTKSNNTDFREALVQQVGEGRFNAMESQIACALINNLDDDGLLLNHHEVYQIIINELGVFHEWIDSVRFRVMDLEPMGCSAIDIYESLMHQAKRTCRYPHEEFMSLLEQVRLDPDRKLSFSKLGRMKDDGALDELKRLHPRPSLAYHDDATNAHAIFPDITVAKYHDGFMVSLVKRASDRLVFKTKYGNGGLEKKSPSPFLRDSRKRAAFMLKSLQFRDSSLAVVANAIVEQQEAWLSDRGPLKPLNLRDISESCGLHESSVSRLVRGKHLFCDKGVFELKYFFSAAVHQDGYSEAQSATTIKDQIRAIINKEDKTAPLSDQKIQSRLKIDGVLVSRRTVAKYRESLHLGSAHERRVLLS